ALEPVRPGEYLGNARYRLHVVGVHPQPDAVVQMRAEEVVDDVEALGALRIVDTADVDDADEPAAFVITEEGRHLDDRFTLHMHGKFPKDDLAGAHGSAERVRHMRAQLLQRLGLNGLVHAAQSYLSMVPSRRIFLCSNRMP